MAPPKSVQNDAAVETRFASRMLLVSMAWDIVLNASVPVLCYAIAGHYLHASEFSALLAASVFPLGKSAYDLQRHGALDPPTAVVGLGIIASIVPVFFGGDPRMLLMRESLFTGAFGLACLVSLLFQHPLMFYFSRYVIAGSDPAKRRAFDSRQSISAVRRAHRVITTVWGVVFIGEFLLRVYLVYTQSAATVLVVSPIALGLATIGTIAWTFWYGSRMRQATR